MSRPPVRRSRAAAALLASVLTAGALTTAFAGAPANAQPSVDTVKSSAAGWTPTDQDRLTEARARASRR